MIAWLIGSAIVGVLCAAHVADEWNSKDWDLAVCFGVIATLLGPITIILAVLFNLVVVLYWVCKAFKSVYNRIENKIKEMV